MVTHKQFEEAIKVVEEYKNQLFNEYKNVSDVIDKLNPVSINKRDTKIIDTDLGVRTINLLRKASSSYGFVFSNMTINDLSVIPLSKFKKTTGFGRKSMLELKSLCHYAGVTLKN